MVRILEPVLENHITLCCPEQHKGLFTVNGIGIEHNLIQVLSCLERGMMSCCPRPFQALNRGCAR